MKKNHLYLGLYDLEWIQTHADYVIETDANIIKESLGLSIKKVYKLRQVVRKVMKRPFVKKDQANIPDWVKLNSHYFLKHNDQEIASRFNITEGRVRVLRTLLRNKYKREAVVEIIYLPDYWIKQQSQ